MWELNHKEGWALKNWCFWTVVLEKTLESPLDCNEIKPVNPKGNQSWILIGKTDAETEAPIIWPPDENWLMKKTLRLGKIEGKRRRDGRGWDGSMAPATQQTWVWETLGDGEGQGILECCSPWNYKELDMAEQLNNKTRSIKTIIRSSNVNWELMDTKEPFMWQHERRAFEA